MARAIRIKWLDEPQKHDYRAAESYLTLVMGPQAAKKTREELENAEMAGFAAKDIFRASGLSLLGISNSHVAKDQSKITLGEDLSPLLLVTDRLHGRLIVADGYHRLCAVYKLDEDAMIPCKLA
jgi:disulfide oxidoreductase YuzD